MNTKKTVLLMIMLLLGFLYFGNTMNAEETESLIWGGQLEDSPEYEEIQDLISDNALYPYVRECFWYENIPITSEELDDIALEPYRVYEPYDQNAIDYFDIGTKNRQEYMDILNECEYTWEFLFKKDGLYVGVNLVKGRPIADENKDQFTPEEIKKAEEEIGKWEINGAFYSKKNRNLREIAEDVIAEKEDIKDYIIVCGAYAGFGNVALGFDDKEVKYIIPLYDTNDKTYILPEGFKNIVPKDKVMHLSDGHLIYEYEDAAPYGAMIWEYSKQYTKEHGLRAGGIPGIRELEKKLKAEYKQENDIWIKAVVMILIAIIAGTTIVISCLKKRKKDKQS